MGEKEFATASFLEAKKKGRKISMLTAYDYSMARLLDDAGIDSLLVGDSLGMVILGYETTLQVTMEEMIHHCRAVARGAKRAMVIGDMPFLSYHISIEESVRNASRPIQNCSGGFPYPPLPINKNPPSADQTDQRYPDSDEPLQNRALQGACYSNQDHHFHRGFL